MQLAIHIRTALAIRPATFPLEGYVASMGGGIKTGKFHQNLALGSSISVIENSYGFKI